MKLLVLILTVLFLKVSAAVAYLEENTAGMAEATAGDQHTNLYRINSQTAVQVKKLKQIDEVVRKRTAAGEYVDAEDIEELVSFEQKDKAKEQIAAIMDEVKKSVAQPKLLRETRPAEFYVQLTEFSKAKVLDAQTAADLQNSLKTRSRR